MPAYAMAIFIDAEFMTDWPHEWVGNGVRCIKRNRNKSGPGFDGLAVLREATVVAAQVKVDRYVMKRKIGWSDGDARTG